MYRVLRFNDETAAERFRLMYSVSQLGIQVDIEDRKRTDAHMDAEADLEDLYDTISTTDFASALEGGTVPPDIVAVAAEHAKADASPFVPRTPSGSKMRFLRADLDGDALVLRMKELTTFKRLKETVERGAPRTNSSLVRQVRELRVFLEQAEKEQQ